MKVAKALALSESFKKLFKFSLGQCQIAPTDGCLDVNPVTKYKTESFAFQFGAGLGSYSWIMF
jgi:hypothetical protein